MKSKQPLQLPAPSLLGRHILFGALVVTLLVSLYHSGPSLLTNILGGQQTAVQSNRSTNQANSTELVFEIDNAATVPTLTVKALPSPAATDANTLGILIESDKATAANAAAWTVESGYVTVINTKGENNPKLVTLILLFPQGHFLAEERPIAKLPFQTTEAGSFEIKQVFLGKASQTEFPPSQNYLIFEDSFTEIEFDATGKEPGFFPAPPTGTSTTAGTTAVVPGSPTSVVATAGNAQATVTWLAPVSNGGSVITRYTVTSAPTALTASTANGTTLTATVTGLANGTSYTFTVVATNVAGNSVPSLASNAITPVAPTTTAGTATATGTATTTGTTTTTGTAATTTAGTGGTTTTTGTTTGGTGAAPVVLELDVLAFEGDSFTVPIHKCQVNELCAAFFSADGGAAPYTYTLQGTAPATGTFLKTNGGIAFYRHTFTTVADHDFGIKVRDANGRERTFDYTIEVSNPTATTTLPQVTFHYSAEEPEPSCDFLDVSASDPLSEVFQFTCKNGVMQGSGGNMRPNDSLNRAEAAKVTSMIRADQNAVVQDFAPFVNLPAASKVHFNDVTVGDWYAPYVYYLFQRGIIVRNTLYRPSDVLNNAEAMKLVFEAYANLNGALRSALAAQPASSQWYAPYRSMANRLDTFIGLVDPSLPAQRGWIAELLYKIYLRYPVDKFEE